MALNHNAPLETLKRLKPMSKIQTSSTLPVVEQTLTQPTESQTILRRREGAELGFGMLRVDRAGDTGCPRPQVFFGRGGGGGV